MTRRRPNLALVREGNPGHRPQDRLDGGARIPAVAPDEPDWKETFPVVRVPSKKRAREELVEFEAIHRAKLARLDDCEERLEKLMAVKVAALQHQSQVQQDVNRRARAVARRTWRRVVDSLDPIRILTQLDEVRLHDLSVVVARIDQLERELSMRGMNQAGERGWQKNGASTQVAQYRTTLKDLAAAFGLDPVARDSLNAPEVDDDGDSPFD